MRCPKCRTLTLLPAGEGRGTGSVVRCPRCPAVFVVRAGAEGAAAPLRPAQVTRPGPLIIDGAALPARSPSAAGRSATAAQPSSILRRYGLAAGAGVLVLALVAVVLFAPDVSALPVIALLQGAR